MNERRKKMIIQLVGFWALCIIGYIVFPNKPVNMKNIIVITLIAVVLYVGEEIFYFIKQRKSKKSNE